MNLLCRRRFFGASIFSVVLLSVLLASPAHAHLTVAGVGEVAGGALHPLMTPAHLLILLGLAFLLGMRIPLNLKWPMAIMVSLSAAALASTATGRISIIPQPVLITLAMIIAVLVALDLKLPSAVYYLLCGLAAIGIGLDSPVEKGNSVVIAKTLAGTWISMNIVTAYVAVCVSNGAEKLWARTGIRIVGSWIIAIAMLVLAFALKK